VDFGGQGLPKTIGAACGEMLNSANMSFALCPLLTDGAIEALLTAGSDELKATYLEKLIERPVDRHHEPDRAAGRQRPGAGAHPRRAAARRQLQALRHQDLHHLR
jgi:alkylation response protein AidB-like acyl-CoA dehydrogenase